MFTTIRAFALGVSVAAALAGGAVQAQTANPLQLKLCDRRGKVPGDLHPHPAKRAP
jgi:hypothetical protein